ncbi:MAG: hypothetical protein LBD86_03990 [Spirochaetaceae bacterium]|jgi:hypothetical protein|nr:hypothetical protein [Spirochaetaceae bacterium]
MPPPGAFSQWLGRAHIKKVKSVYSRGYNRHGFSGRETRTTAIAKGSDAHNGLFSGINDPRVGRNKLYPMHEVMAITIPALIGMADPVPYSPLPFFTFKAFRYAPVIVKYLQTQIRPQHQMNERRFTPYTAAGI